VSPNWSSAHVAVIFRDKLKKLHHRLPLITAGLLLILAAPDDLGLPNRGPTPVLVELFTSEGCSSCPSADDVLRRLAERQPVPGVEILVMSEHVDYWNSLGWSDPFSSAQFSERQNAYARARGRDDIYTPQMIVDGHEEFVGNDWDEAVGAVSRAGQKAKAWLDVTRISSDGTNLRLHVRMNPIPGRASGEVAEMYLAITENNLSTKVASGENKGRQLAHTGVVRKLNRIGHADTGKIFDAEPSIRLDRRWKLSDLRILVFAQERQSRRILAASIVSVLSQ